MRLFRSVLLAAVLASSAAAAEQMPDAAALKAQLVALETQSWVAWKNHDGKFFERFLSDDHVEVQPGSPAGKAAVVAGVASPACVVSDYRIGDFRLTIFTPTTALLLYRAEQTTLCGGAPVPSPVWASSLFVKRAGRWRNALYVHTPAR